MMTLILMLVAFAAGYFIGRRRVSPVERILSPVDDLAKRVLSKLRR